MSINWTTGEERRQQQILNLPKVKKVKIRRKIGGRGFYHRNKVVEEGETIECDHDIAATLVSLGKAEIA